MTTEGESRTYEPTTINEHACEEANYGPVRIKRYDFEVNGQDYYAYLPADLTPSMKRYNLLQVVAAQRFADDLTKGAFGQIVGQEKLDALVEDRSSQILANSYDYDAEERGYQSLAPLFQRRALERLFLAATNL